MYTPKAFAECDWERIRRLIQTNAFGTLVTFDGCRPEASHVPFLLDGERRLLSCHLAAANPQARRLAEGTEALMMFQGPHAYVSPTWYENAGVPTWNYAAVHIYGRPEEMESEAELGRFVEQLAARYESARANPWRPEYPRRMLSAIRGFRVHITEVQGKFKLSQNRPAEDRRNVMRRLPVEGGAMGMAVAELMRERDE